MTPEEKLKNEFYTKFCRPVMMKGVFKNEHQFEDTTYAEEVFDFFVAAIKEQVAERDKEIIRLRESGCTVEMYQLDQELTETKEELAEKSEHMERLKSALEVAQSWIKSKEARAFEGSGWKSIEEIIQTALEVTK